MSEPIVPFDPLGHAVLQTYVLPALQDFERTRPDSDTVRLAAANAIIYLIGNLLVALARLNSGLDNPELASGKNGMLVSDYTFTPTLADTLAARTAMGQLIAGDNSAEKIVELAAALPTRREPRIGQYL